VVLAIHLLHSHCKHLKYEKEIYLVTDGRGSMDFDDLEGIKSRLKQIDIKLTVLYDPWLHMSFPPGSISLIESL
jgi:ATP-dependent DNA helicase 2 subunit 2